MYQCFFHTVWKEREKEARSLWERSVRLLITLQASLPWFSGWCPRREGEAGVFISVGLSVQQSR